MQEQKLLDDWREDITSEQETLKLEDGESAEFVFMDNGRMIKSGDAILFKVEQDEEPKCLFVNRNNFKLLGQIKELGALPGLKVKLSRKGKEKKDTRYTIEKIE